MRKTFQLLAICFCLLFSCASFAQPTPGHSPRFDPEKIYLFDVDIQVRPDGIIRVTENITLNAQWNQIRRGIYRDLPVSLTEQTQPVSLTMDGLSHPFFTERKNGSLRVNFGNDNYISKGVHTYSFVYTYTGAINFLKNYDELYWNVTGNEWDFPIDKARVHVTFPSDTSVRTNGISFYTGKKGSKNQQAEQTAPLTFETTAPLTPREGFTIAIPLAKGTIQKPALSQRLDGLWFFPLVLWLGLFLFLIGYFIFTWFAVGKDPAYLAVAQYDPPQGISPAFLYYLQNMSVDAKLFSAAILDLAMKGYIEIKTNADSATIPPQDKPNKAWGFVLNLFSSARLIRTDKQPDEHLSYEEQQLLQTLFPFSHTLALNSSAAKQFEQLSKSIKTRFEKDAKQYIVSNSSLVLTTTIITIILGVVPFIFFKRPELIFINLHFSIFFLTSTLALHKLPAKIGMGLFLTLFYSAFWFASGTLNTPDLLLCQLMFLVSIWGLSFYSTLIRNVTPHGRDIFEQIAGFKKYMKTAETHRVAASDPLETERIFCNYLPFAFALGMENKWIEKFSRMLSQATLEKCTRSVGNMNFVSKGLSRSIASAMPSGGHGASHGGGCSGGGHGGGGGGGR